MLVTGNPPKVNQLRPQPGPQEVFLSTSADIALYGGSAGGGKTFGLLLEPLRSITQVKGFGVTIFRRTTPQIKNEGGLWDESRKMYSQLGAEPAETITRWKFPPFDNKIKFAHLEYDKTLQDYQGSQIPLICFDELTHFSEKQFFYMLSRNRSVCGVKPYVRATTNPDSESWVAKFIEWWIDQETGYPITERSGVVRWFARVGDVIEWADTAQELRDRFPEIFESEETKPKSFTFIAATLEDNKILMEKDPSYKANLLMLPRVEREQLLKGNWKVKHSAGDYFPESKVTVVDALPNDVRRFCRGWDLAATEPSQSNPDPDSTSGVLIGIANNNDIYIVDRKNKKINSDDVKNLVRNTAMSDGYQCAIRLPQDPGQAGKDQAANYVRYLSGFNVKTAPVTGDKEVRSRALSAQWQAGNVYIVRGDWNESYLAEMNAFPLGAHDDDVDASNEAFAELTLGVAEASIGRTTGTHN